MTLLLLLLTAAVPQDDPVRAIDALIEKLSSDDPDARERAAHELAALGPAALDTLRKRAATADADLKLRLTGIAEEIERHDRLRFCTGTPRRITLKADRTALKDVLAELRKQTPTPVVLKDVAADTAISVDLQDALLFEALDRICRAHGGIQARLPSGRIGSGQPITIEKGDPRDVRRHVEQQFALDVTGVHFSQSGDFTGKLVESVSISFAFGGEVDVRPIDARLVVDSVVDDQGTAHALRPTAHRDNSSSGIPPVTWFSARLAQLPPPAVKRFREISGTLDLTFPSDVHVARIPQPLGRKDVEVAGGPASFTLRDFAKEDDTFIATLDTEWRQSREPMSEQRRFEVVDDAGRIFGNTGGHGHGGGGGLMHWTYPFELPPGARVAELRAVKMQTSGERVKRTIKWTFKDVPLRP